MNIQFDYYALTFDRGSNQVRSLCTAGKGSGEVCILCAAGTYSMEV